MLVAEQLQRGDLDEALAQVQSQVRADPANAKHRILLFQILSVLGQWDRALNQLNVAGELDAGALAMVQTYREALQCEALRADAFQGRRSPLIFGQPEQWMGLLLEALRLSGEGHDAEAQEVRDQAFEAAPETPGTVDGKPFQWIADADMRLGPMLEAIVNGRYYWVPFFRIRKMQFDEPADLRDSVWMPVYFTWSNQGEAAGLIPTRYVGSESSGDPLVRLARRTTWDEREAGLYVGLGQRMLATDADDIALMDARIIELETAEEPSDTG